MNLATLYDHQAVATERLRENIRADIKNQILCAPTGSGKTEIACHMIQRAVELRKRAIFVVDRISLLDQTSARFDKYGIAHGVIQANHWRWRPWERVQVASAQTLARRQWPADLDLIIVDEAHGLNKVVLERIAKRDCVTVGLTATPFTRGLGKHYDAIVNAITTRDLIAQGYLAPYRVFAASEPDMEGAKVVAGEWTDDEVEKRALPIVGDCVREYFKHGEGQKFICFGSTVRHCEALQRQFQQAGINCGLYTYHTPDEERKEMLREFSQPDSRIRGLISVAALARGFDREDIGVVIVARPLRSSLAEHIQCIGRGLRRDPNNAQKVCTILDHAGNMLRFWDETNEFFDVGCNSLDMGKPKPKAKPKARTRKALKCPTCAHVHPTAPSCPMCGFEYRVADVQHQHGELVGLGDGAAAPWAVKVSIYAQLLWLCLKRGYKPGWTAYQYRNIFGVWPRGLENTEPVEASPEVRAMVRERAKQFSASTKSAPVQGPKEDFGAMLDRKWPVAR